MDEIRTSSREDSILVYLHIHKTAGRSFGVVLSRQFSNEAQLSLDGNMALRKCLMNMSEDEHRKLQLIVGHLKYGVHEFLMRPTHYITMLRHPVARAISEYTYMCANSSDYYPVEYQNGKISFDEHIERAPWAINQQILTLSGYCDLPESQNFPQPIPLDALDRAKDNLSEFDFVGLTDRFDESLLILQGLFHWKYTYYVKRNMNNGAPISLSKTTKRRLEQACEKELELYEHAEHIFAEKIKSYGKNFQRELDNFRRRNALFKALWHASDRLPLAIHSKIRRLAKQILE